MNSQPSRPTVLCIYHGNCADGFTAAWVLYNYFAINEPNREVEFFAAHHQTREVPDVDGKDVYILDYAYSPSVMVDIARRASTLTWIDHHKSNREVLNELSWHNVREVDNVNTVFSLSNSGAMLTWKYFDPGNERVPRIVELVEDRDMWWFKQDETRWFSAVLFSHEYDFDTWTKLDFEISYARANAYVELKLQGEAILRKQHKDIAELLPVLARRLTICGHEVPAANLPYTLASEAGHELAKGEPFAAIYYDTPQGRCFSLRSDKNGMDVSKIAQVHGGGGHKHAAGFTVPFSIAAGFEV